MDQEMGFKRSIPEYALERPTEKLLSELAVARQQHMENKKKMMSKWCRKVTRTKRSMKSNRLNKSTNKTKIKKYTSKDVWNKTVEKPKKQINKKTKDKTQKE